MTVPAALPSPDALALKRARDEGYAEGAAWAAQRTPYLLARAREEGAREAAEAIYAAVTAGVRRYRDHPGAVAIEGDFQEPALKSANL